MENALIDCINNYGFPVAVCAAMGYFVKYSYDNNRKDINDMNEKHREEIKELTSVIENNTLAIQKLVNKLEGSDLDG